MLATFLHLKLVLHCMLANCYLVKNLRKKKLSKADNKCVPTHTINDSCKILDYPDSSMFEQEFTMLNKVAQKYLGKKYALFIPFQLTPHLYPT